MELQPLPKEYEGVFDFHVERAYDDFESPVQKRAVRGIYRLDLNLATVTFLPKLDFQLTPRVVLYNEDYQFTNPKQARRILALTSTLVLYPESPDAPDAHSRGPQQVLTNLSDPKDELLFKDDYLVTFFPVDPEEFASYRAEIRRFLRGRGHVTYHHSIIGNLVELPKLNSLAFATSLIWSGVAGKDARRWLTTGYK